MFPELCLATGNISLMDYHAAVKTTIMGTSPVVQWLRLPMQGVWGLIPRQGTRFHMPQLKDTACRK